MVFVAMAVGGNVVHAVSPPIERSPFPDLTVFSMDNTTIIGAHFDGKRFNNTIGIASLATAVFVPSQISPTGFAALSQLSFTSGEFVSAHDLALSVSVDVYPFLKQGGYKCGAAGCTAAGILFTGTAASSTVADAYKQQGVATQIRVNKTGVFNTCMAIDTAFTSSITTPSTSSFGMGIMPVDADAKGAPAVTHAPAYMGRYVRPLDGYDGTTAGKIPFVYSSEMTKPFDPTKSFVHCAWTFMNAGQYLTFALKVTGSDSAYVVGSIAAGAETQLIAYSIGFGGFLDVNGPNVSAGYSMAATLDRKHLDYNDIRTWMYDPFASNGGCSSSPTCVFNETGAYGSDSADCVFVYAPRATRIVGIGNMSNQSTGKHDFVMQLFGGPTAADLNLLGGVGIGTGATADFPTAQNWADVFTDKFFIPNTVQRSLGSGVAGGGGFGIVNITEDIATPADVTKNIYALGELHGTVDANSIIMGVIKADKPKQVLSMGLAYDTHAKSPVYKDTVTPPVYLVSMGGDAGAIVSAGADIQHTDAPACVPTSTATASTPPFTPLPSAYYGATIYALGGDRRFNDATIAGPIIGPTGPTDITTTPPTQTATNVMYCAYGSHGPAYVAGTIKFTIELTTVLSTATTGTAALAFSAYRQSYLGNYTHEDPISNFGSILPMGSPQFDEANALFEHQGSKDSFSRIVKLDAEAETETITLEVAVGSGERGAFDSARLVIACVDASPTTNPGEPAAVKDLCKDVASKGATYTITATFTPAQIHELTKGPDGELDQIENIKCNSGLTGGKTTQLAHTIIHKNSAGRSVGDPAKGCRVANGSVWSEGGNSKCTTTLPTWGSGLISDPALASTLHTTTDHDIFNYAPVNATAQVSKVYYGKLYATAKAHGTATVTVFNLNATKLLLEKTSFQDTKATGSKSITINENTTGLSAIPVNLFASDVANNQPNNMMYGVDMMYPSGQIMPALYYEFNGPGDTSYISELHVILAIDKSGGSSSSHKVVLAVALGVTMLMAALF